MSRGVYFSANDAVLPWARAFLNSFRESNPATELYLIPFDENDTTIRALGEEYDFGVYTSPEFDRLERIGLALETGHTSYGHHWFRRYSAFWGPLEEFAYLDARQVVLMDLEPLITAPSRFGFDLVYCDAALDQVYAPGPMRLGFLAAGGAKGFMSNAWASRRGVFAPEDFSAMLPSMLEQRSQLNPRNTDQAFINYCLDSRGMQSARISELLGDLVASGWARQPGRVYRDRVGVYRLWDHGGLEHGKRLLHVHWAGLPYSLVGPKGGLLWRFGRPSLRAGMRGLLRGARVEGFRALKASRRLNTAFKAVRGWVRGGSA